MNLTHHIFKKVPQNDLKLIDHHIELNQIYQDLLQVQQVSLDFQQAQVVGVPMILFFQSAISMMDLNYLIEFD